MRVLLIEDNPGDARLVKEMLLEDEEGGEAYDLQAASTLAEGLRALSSRHFDIILLDLSLPDSLGLRTLSSIRAAVAETPIVLLTGYDDWHVAQDALQQGAQGYLVKNTLDASGLLRSIRFAQVRAGGGGAVHAAEPATRGKLVGMIGATGGAGTTTLACGAALALYGKTGERVLLVDANAGCEVLAYLMEASSALLSGDLQSVTTLLGTGQWKKMASSTPSGVDVFAAPVSMEQAADAGALIGESLASARLHYDWIVVDLGRFQPSLSQLLPAFDDVSLVATGDMPSLRESGRIRKAIAGLSENLRHVRLVVNRVAADAVWSGEKLQLIMGAGPSSMISDCPEIKAAYREGKLDERALKGSVAELIAQLPGVREDKSTTNRWHSLTRLATG